MNILKERDTWHKFKKEVPPLSLIEEIVNDAIEYAPVKNNVYCFKAKVFGPEYHEEKLELFTHTMCVNQPFASAETNKLFQRIRQEHKESPSEEVKKLSIEHIKKNNDEQHRKSGRVINGVPSYALIQFNQQALAPYLIRFEIAEPYMPNHDVIKRYGKDYGHENFERPLIGLSMYAYCISLVAQSKGLNSGFLGCITHPNYYTALLENKNASKFPFFLGLGYGDHKETAKKQKPKLEQVVNFA